MSGAAWMPGLIPAARQGWWKRVGEASSDEILAAIAWDEAKARDDDAAIHWMRWVGLHSAYVRALADEIRADLARPSAAAAGGERETR